MDKSGHSQVGLGITSRGFDEGGSNSGIGAIDDFVTNSEAEDVGIREEFINGLDVKVEKIGCPGRGDPINGAVHGQRQINTVGN
jgi:hypothetical protein